MYIAEEWGQQIKSRRVARGWTQGQLAEAVAIPQSQVSVFERYGRGLDIDRVARLCEAVGLELVLMEKPVEEL